MTYLSCNSCWYPLTFVLNTVLVKSHEHKGQLIAGAALGDLKVSPWNYQLRRHSFCLGIVACVFSFITAKWKSNKHLFFLFVLFLSVFFLIFKILPLLWTMWCFIFSEILYFNGILLFYWICCSCYIWIPNSVSIYLLLIINAMLFAVMDYFCLCKI